MVDLVVTVATGFLTFLAGVWLLIREKRLFADSIIAAAKVVGYIPIRGQHGYTYAMSIEYNDYSGKLVRTEEMSSSKRKKYEIGTDLLVQYSKIRPEMFIVAGSKKRVLIMWGMIIIGLLMMAVFGYIFGFK